MTQIDDVVEKQLPNGKTIRFRLGDVNGDGQLDQDDMDLLTTLSADNYMSEFLLERLSIEELSSCDINQDGLINHADLAVLCNHVLSQLEMQALTDELTGLFNRRGLKEKVYLKLRAAKKFDSHLACLAIDIDYFKQINDQYGHDIGDAALCHLARVLKVHTRNSDVVARQGGEEFVVFLEDADEKGALIAAEKIRGAVESAVLTVDEQTIPLTISVGVALFQKTMGLQDLLKNADAALYEAKESGRNRTVFFRADAVE